MSSPDVLETLRAIKQAVESLQGTEMFNALSPMLTSIDHQIEKAEFSQGIGSKPWMDGPYIVTPSKEDTATFHIRSIMGKPTKEAVPYTALLISQAPVMVDILFRMNDNSPLNSDEYVEFNQWADEFQRKVLVLKRGEKK